VILTLTLTTKKVKVIDLFRRSLFIKKLLIKTFLWTLFVFRTLFHTTYTFQHEEYITFYSLLDDTSFNGYKEVINLKNCDILSLKSYRFLNIIWNILLNNVHSILLVYQIVVAERITTQHFVYVHQIQLTKLIEWLSLIHIIKFF